MGSGVTALRLASLPYPGPGYFMEQPVQDFRAMMDVNYFGTLHTIKVAVPCLGSATRPAQSPAEVFPWGMSDQRPSTTGIWRAERGSGEMRTPVRGLGRGSVLRKQRASRLFPGEPGASREEQIKWRPQRLVAASSRRISRSPSPPPWQCPLHLPLPLHLSPAARRWCPRGCSSAAPAASASSARLCP